MSSQVIVAGTLALMMLGLLLEATFFAASKSDPPALYKMFAVRDNLIRLVAEQRIDRNDPHFSAIYNNVNLILTSCRLLSGPDGWQLAETQGRHFAHFPKSGKRLDEVPSSSIPSELLPVIADLADGLGHIIENHFGVYVQIDAKKREQRKLQKERAQLFLEMITHQQDPLPAWK